MITAHTLVNFFHSPYILLVFLQEVKRILVVLKRVEKTSFLTPNVRADTKVRPYILHCPFWAKTPMNRDFAKLNKLRPYADEVKIGINLVKGFSYINKGFFLGLMWELLEPSVV